MLQYLNTHPRGVKVVCYCTSRWARTCSVHEDHAQSFSFCFAAYEQKCGDDLSPSPSVCLDRKHFLTAHKNSHFPVAVDCTEAC